MARFWQRTKTQLTAPAQYIQTTDRVSRPMAVMMSLVLFFVAIAIIVGLVFAGIWGYNKVTGNSSKPASPITGISTGVSTDSKNDGATQGSSGAAAVTSNGTGTATVTTNQPANSSSSATTNQSTATTAGSVPNTGAGSTLGIFIAATILGTLLYRSILIRRLQ